MRVAGSYQEDRSLKEAQGPLPSSGQRADKSPRSAYRRVPLAHRGLHPPGIAASLLPRKRFGDWEVDQVSGKEKGEIPKREPSLLRLHVVF